MLSLLILTAVMYSVWIAANVVYARRTHWTQINQQLGLLVFFMGGLGLFLTWVGLASTRESYILESIDMTKPLNIAVVFVAFSMGYYALLIYMCLCGAQLFGRHKTLETSNSEVSFSVQEFIRNRPWNRFVLLIALFKAALITYLAYKIASTVARLSP